MVFLLIFTLVFYGVGLYLYLKTEKLKPAGATFTVIGVILFPLNGLAFYKFIFEGHSGNIVWFVTSVLTLLFYSLALKYTKKIYLNYLSAFVCLSIFESFISLFEFPIYYLFWGMAIYGLIVALFAKFSKKKFIIQKPLILTADIFLPLSILGALTMTTEFGMFSVGVNIFLAAMYYLLLSFVNEKEVNCDIYITLSAILFPLSAVAIIADKCPDKINYLAIMIVFSIIYMLLAKQFGKLISENRIIILTIVSTTIAAVACVVAIGDNFLLLVSLAIAMLVGLYGFINNKNFYSLIIFYISYLIIPAMFSSVLSFGITKESLLII